MRKALLGLLLAGILTAGAFASGPVENLSQVELYQLGRKFENLPLEARVVQLEQYLQQPPPGNVSLDYRINRLLAIAGLQVSQDAATQAIRAYNRGVELSEAGRLAEAMASYRLALQANPRLIEAYNNLGNLLERQEQYEAALENYRLAIHYAPDNALLYKNLGVLYQRLGQVPQAMQAYRDYMDRLPPSASDPAVGAMLDEYESLRRLADRDPDYFAVVTSSSEGHLLSWPGFMNPVPVHVELESPEQAAFLPLVLEGMDAWEKATGSLLRFRQTNRAEDARIRIVLSEGPLSDPYLNVGHAQYFTESRRNIFKSLRVAIRINTGSNQVPASGREAQIRRLVLHELGHAIGIWGHSNNPEDIMYTHPIASGLSERDISTVRKLYGEQLSGKD